MKTSELKAKTAADLEQQLLELRKEQFNLRMQSSMAQMPKPHLFKKLRKDVARIKTILTEKKSAAS